MSTCFKGKMNMHMKFEIFVLMTLLPKFFAGLTAQSQKDRMRERKIPLPRFKLGIVSLPFRITDHYTKKSSFFFMIVFIGQLELHGHYRQNIRKL